MVVEEKEEDELVVGPFQSYAIVNGRLQLPVANAKAGTEVKITAQKTRTTTSVGF